MLTVSCRVQSMGAPQKKAASKVMASVRKLLADVTTDVTEEEDEQVPYTLHPSPYTIHQASRGRDFGRDLRGGGGGAGVPRSYTLKAQPGTFKSKLTPTRAFLAGSEEVPLLCIDSRLLCRRTPVIDPRLL